MTVPLDRRLEQLRTVVERLERLPASARREWMLREARARVADVETGVEPRAMRTFDEEPPAPRPKPPPQTGARKARAGERRESGRGRPETRPVVSTQPPRSEPAVAPATGSSAGEATLGRDELLWLGDPAGDTLAAPGDDPNEIAPWRRGLRG